MSFSLAFTITYVMVGFIIIGIEVFVIHSKKIKGIKKTFIIAGLGILLVGITYFSQEIISKTHKFFLFNFPFQKDIFAVTKKDGKPYILLDIKRDSTEMVEVEINEEEKSVKIFKNTLVKEKFSSGLEFETFNSEKVELID